MENFWQKPIETLQELLHRKAPHLRQIRHHFSPALGRELSIDVYLPPDYHLSSGKQYPLVLFNDGQDLPVMRFSHILETLYQQKAIPYCIVVGIHADERRAREYGTLRQMDYKGRGDLAPQHHRFVVEELLPYLRQRFRLSPHVADCVYAGFSLGGLSAFDVAWANPHIFGAAGVFSGALWWRWEPVRDEDPDAGRIMHDVVRHTGHPARHQHFWFQAGTLDEEDDRNHNGIIDAIDDTFDLMAALRDKGIPTAQIRYLQVEGGRHDQPTWGQAMPDFLKWVLGNRDHLGATGSIVYNYGF